MSNGSELVYEMSGLLFGVCRERGIEILIHSMIEKCFEDIGNNEGKLKAIVEQHKEIFWLNWKNIRESIILKYSSFDNGNINNLTNYINYELGGYACIREDLRRIFDIWNKSSSEDWSITQAWGYSETIRLLIDNLEQQDSDTTWLSDFVKKLCLFVVNDIDQLSVNIVKELRGLVDLVSVYNKPIPKFGYSKLNKVNWTKWISITNDAAVIFPEVYPNPKDFDNWRNVIFDNPTQLLSEDFSLLISSLNIIHEENKWLTVTERLVNLFGVLNYQQRTLNIDKLYEFAYLILRKFNSEKLKDALRNSIFLQTVQQEDLNLIPSIKFILAYVYENEIMTTNDPVRAEIKDYWSSGSDQKMTETVTFFEKPSDLELISYFARDSHNKLAQYILRKNSSGINFTSNSEDYRFVDEVCNNIGDEDFKVNYIQSLCSNSLIDDELSNFQDQPIIYSECFNLLILFGTDSIKEKILRVIKNISIESWREDLRSDKKLIDLFDHDLNLDHKFSEAFAEWLDFSMLNQDDQQDKVWNFFKVIEHKILDRQNVYSRLKNKFFENNPIYWSDMSIQYVSEFWVDITDIDFQYIIDKLNLWIDAKSWSQIEWVVELLEDQVLRSEILESRVRANLENEQHSEEIKQILENLLLKIIVDTAIEPPIEN